MIAFLLKISIVFTISTLLFYVIAVLNRKVDKKFRKMVVESGRAWTEVASRPCRDDICFFCGKDIDERSIFVQHMHRAVSAEMTTPMNLSTVYEDKVVSIPCCEGCLAANKVADAKANRNTWIVALLAFAAVFAALMYLFHGHSGAWLVAAAHALLAGIVVHSVAGWIAKPAYRKKIEENPVVAELRGKTWKIGAAPGAKMSIELADLCRTITLPGGATMEMIYCPPGEFMMGSPASEDGRDDDEEQHRVKLTKGFWLGKYAVTQRQWKSVMGSNPSYRKGDNLPVESVSWDDCQEFIGKVNALLRCGARLPTEAEWEYACRAGTSTAYSWGDALNGDKANCDGNYPCGTEVKGMNRKRTVKVDKYAPNPWGFYCMHGNVEEWCSDLYNKAYYKRSPADDPLGPASGASRVLRGGGWYNGARYCRSAYRYECTHDIRTPRFGFRLCCSAEPEMTTPMKQEISLDAVEVGTISLNDVCVAFKDWKSNPFFIGEYIPDDLKCFVAQETGCSEDDVLAVYGKSPEKETSWFAVLRCGLALRADAGIGVERQVMYLPWTSIWYISFDDRNSGIPSCLYISNFPENAPYKSGVIDLQHLSKSDMELVYNSLRWLAEASDDGSTHWTGGWRRCLRVWTTKYSFIPEPNQVWPIWSHFD